MKNFERGERESLDSAISRIAYAYGFSSPAVTVSRKALSDAHAALPSATPHTAAISALIAASTPTPAPTQLWSTAKKGGGTILSFTILAARHAVAHALVVKAALSVAERAGYTDLTVSVSSVGDAESQRRFERELNNFFKKNAAHLPAEVRGRVHHHALAVYEELRESGTELAARLPRPIDSLSESSRRIMTETLALFESVGIAYSLAPYLGHAAVNTELVFEVSGTDKRGERSVLATGGRFDDIMKRHHKGAVPHTVGMSLSLETELELEHEDTLSCFVVHVGPAARLKAFQLLESLWRAHAAVGHALMTESLRDQMDTAKTRDARYIAIIGQREALDNTILLRNATTQMQISVPVAKLITAINR